MDRGIVEQNVRLVLHTDKPPSKLIELTDSFYLQSSTTLSLKPNQEPARIHICSALAVEKLGDQLGLPAPDISKPPIPPAQYRKLLNQFRDKLVPDLAHKAPRTPTKSPARRTKQDTASPQRRVRATRQKAVDYLKEELDDDGDNDDDDNDFHDLALDKDDDDGHEPEEFSTPRKRPPSSLIKGSPSPRKSPRKRVAGPDTSKIEAISERMGLEPQTVDAILQAYEQYKELVKDAWGLLYGLFVVITDRAEPKQGAEHERRLATAIGQIAPDVFIDRDEWVGWAEKIVTGQTWIMNISKRPEAQPNLVGAPGGWGLGVEFSLV